MNAKPPLALTIAGSDPSGGAGIQEDLKVFTELGVHGLSVVSAITVQSSFGMRSSKAVDPVLVSEQINCLLEDRPPAGAKTGLLTVEALPVIIKFLKKVSFPVVVDPIFESGSGLLLAFPQMIELYRKEVIPRAALITPNIPEVESLLDITIVDNRSLEGAARSLLDLGAQAVLIKGGHLKEDQVVDLFLTRTDARRFVKPRRGFREVHGTGCTLSAAITAFLARGSSLAEAVASAEAYIDRKLADLLYAGEGTPIINHLKGV
ncbi:MAG: bifunctional hydroxymethylpyrimidine kinase/phosphomethylpyrimidine kinase [candidate division WOR-3 bacterium]|nr:bifunctional hydroxymethylpyrimidine kinase/phosphomethylpyrimidine kinase [candidate division WOR-3 bacterium]